MKAAILAIGSELLGTDRLDTNSLALTAVLERYGVDTATKSVVGDDEGLIARELSNRLQEVDLVLVTGGLGPTRDDRTRSAVARALGRGLSLDETIVEHIRGLFASFGRTMPEVNRRQGEVIDGARVLVNDAGTAPGQHLEHEGRHVFLFPGVPREMRALVDRYLEPWLEEKLGTEGAATERRTLRVACLPESEVEERIAGVYERHGRDAVAVLASPGDIRVVAVARGTRKERGEKLDAVTEDLRRAIGPAVYGTGEEQLEEVVGRLLGQAGLMLVTAESCTGGWIAEHVTRVPGSSAWFEGGVVTYSYGLKTRLLGVPKETLERYGAVSREVVEDMARGARERYGGDLAIAVSGIAGPGGATDDKPVGTVHFALAGPGDDDLEHRLQVFPGDRKRVRLMTCRLALEMVRRKVLQGIEGPRGSDQEGSA